MTRFRTGRLHLLLACVSVCLLNIEVADAAQLQISCGDVRNLNVPATVVQFRIANEGDCSARIEFFEGANQSGATLLDITLWPGEVGEVNRPALMALSIRASVGIEGEEGATIVTSGLALEFAGFGRRGDDLYATNIGNLGIGTHEPQAKLDVRGSISGFGVVPVGSIVAWHSSLAGVSTLPEGWTECNGQTIADPESPFDGLTLEDLNGDARFLRGASTSGTLQDDQFQTHSHALLGQDPDRGVGGWSCSEAQGGACGGTSQIFLSVGEPNSGRHGSETRPKNMSVVWIIRIK